MKWFVDVVGIGSFVALCAGVYLVAGLGWALIAFGTPLFALYLWHETLLVHRLRGRV